MMAEQDEFYDSHATLCASSQFPYNIIDFASNNKCKLQITDNLYRFIKGSLVTLLKRFTFICCRSRLNLRNFILLTIISE